MHISTIHANKGKMPLIDVMEINHCREGRFECEFSDGCAVYLGAGDLAANMLTHPPRVSWFPLSHYHGISVMVDLRAAQDTLCQISRIFNNTPIDLYALRDHLCGGGRCFIMRATDAIQHIFSELYAVPPAIRGDYCKLKVLELLLFLSSADLPALRENRAYITRSQADTVRSIRTYLVEHLDQHITLPMLAPFDIKELRELMETDEMELDTLGDRKTALFVIISDTDDTFNFVVSILYTQLFNLLCDKADDEYGGRLPVHVRCLLDEFANIGQIPKFEKLIATIRSREISASIILQSQSQLKAIYKDNADTIVGNCDTTLFLGGKEKSTLKEISEILGKETIDSFNTSETRGRELSHGMNYQKLGKDVP